MFSNTQLESSYTPIKYSYLIASKQPASHPVSDWPRLIQAPIKRGGHIVYEACHKDGWLQSCISHP